MEVRKKMIIRKPKEPEFMKELHKIREEMYEETKNLTPKERIKKTRKDNEEFLKSRGYRLVPANKGYRVERVKK
ncbi:MAG: hypothetical protein ACE5GU_08790 [Candidatus Scalinduaceae bacterium]